MSLILVGGCAGGSSPTPTSQASPTPTSQAQGSSEASATSGATTDFHGETLSINSWGGDYWDHFHALLVQTFETRYNAKVIETPSLTSATVAKVQAEAAHPTLDVVLVAEHGAAVLKNSNLLQPLDASAIPNLNNLVQGAVPDGAPYVNFEYFGDVIAYNTNKVQTPPTSWEDLWNPAYAGHVIISGFGTCCGMTFLLEVNHMQGGDYRTTVDPGFAKLESLKPNLLTVFSNQDQAAQMLASGQAWLAEFASDRTGTLINSGAPVALVYPKDGVAPQADSIGIVKGTQHLQLAEAFINYVLDAKLQSDLMPLVLDSPVNKDSKVSAQAASLMMTPDDFSRSINLDQTFIATQFSTWNERWNKLFGTK
jgi:putative spermidine/putrescine transport system substrate-binding protein